MAIAAFALARASEITEATTADVAVSRRGVLLASLAAIGMLHAPASTAAQAPQHHKAEVSAADTLRQDMRKLWTDHVVWTRAYVVAAVADQPDARAAATRLLKKSGAVPAASLTAGLRFAQHGRRIRS
jgi:ABC-type Fe3+ transport system substrate-binding protein